MRLLQILSLLAWLVAAPAWAQVETGTLSGSITNEPQIPVINATVQLSNAATSANLSASTGKSGDYQFSNLPPGTYDFNVTATGLRPFARRGIRISASASTFDVNLEERSPASLEQLRTAFERTPEDPVILYRLGKAYLKIGDIEKASPFFLKAVEVKPDDLASRAALAQIALIRADGLAVLRYTEEMLRVAPKNEVGHLLRASVFLRMAKPDEAKPILDAVLLANPNNVDALIQLGTLQLTARKFADAEEPFRRAYNLDPTNLRGLEGLAEIQLQQNQFDQAVQLVAAEVKKEPQRRDLRRLLANVEFRGKQFDRAIADWRELLPTYQDSPLEQAAVRALIGLASTEKKDFPSAFEEIRKAIQLAPENVAYARQLATALELAGRKPEAIVAYRAALKIAPNDAITLNNLAYLLADTDTEEALRLGQQARRLAPASADILDTMGWIYIKKGLTDSAARLFEDLTRDNPKSAVMHYHYGVALLGKNDREGALKEFNLSLGNQPTPETEAAAKEMIRKLSTPTATPPARK